MQKIVFTLAILSLIFSAFEARAEKTKLISFVMPATQGYVLSVDLPEISTAGKWRRSIKPTQWGYEIEFQSRSSKFSLDLNVYSDPTTIEKIANREKGYLKKANLYETGFNNALGQKTFFYLLTHKFFLKDGKKIKIKATKPTTKTYLAVFDKRVFLKMRTFVRPPFSLTKSLPLFEKIASSIKVTPVSAMAPEQLSRYFSSPDTRLSQRRDYYLNATLTTTLPPGWTARVVTAEPASGSAGQGKVVVEVTPNRKLPPGRYEKLTLVLEGIPMSKASSLAGFLDTAKAYRVSALPNPKKIDTPEPVVLPGVPRFCSMDRKVQGGVSTGKVHVSTYTGKDRDGQDRKVRVYTAGGFTMACNVIYTADPETFDASRERVGAILNSLKIEIESPEKTKLVTVVTPAVNGYVLSVDLPKTGTDEKWKRSIKPSEGDISIYTNSDSANLSLTFRVYGKPKSFENYVNYWERSIEGYQNIYEKGFNNALGQNTFFYLSSNQTISVGGKKVKATKPTTKTYLAIVYKRIRLVLTVHSGPRQFPPLALNKSLPLFEKIASSIKVTPVSAMAPEQLSRYFSSPNTRLSQRRDYYLNATLTTTLPPGWTARVVTAEPASGSAGQGKVVVEVTPNRKLPPGRYEKLALVLEGIPIPKAFSLAGFLDTAKAQLALVLPNPRTIETPETVAMPGSTDGSGFCYMYRKVRRGVSTGKVHVSTYAGKDRDGQDRKVRVYTAGGFTMACNVIYTADPETFNGSQERIGAILKSLRIVVESPILSVR